ncbi:hypothetical protein KCT76_000299 [Listeria monocytogenes]|uniref:hypothetical protein n=1 Tax=Listeria monocytogenes TaxID=1639 RepID=UPI0010F1DFAF|nr:hypothetical protein [Listeria monocytogenes]EAD5122181.1 hypothetical protein [Listeria monocytogenes]EAE3588652.1 hypothetical protein [Listeria monocytogenes]EFU5041777.1 hypothetical protein [Listeria monocytogenes]EHK9344627.1 hypothetical protein [Listeria monocytogenes]EHK9353364.1 hypothetical protein [Listeria monocytogenes]
MAHFNIERQKKSGRTIEFCLGLCGGIFGVLAATTMLGFTIPDIGDIDFSYWLLSIVLTSIFSISGVVGSLFVRKYHLLGGVLMLGAAIGGVLSQNMFFIMYLAFPLLLIGGLIALIRGGEFLKLFSMWWFYIIIASSIFVPILLFRGYY